MPSELSPRGEELNVSLSYGGDWIWPGTIAQTELRRLFFFRLPIVAPQVRATLEPIIEAIYDLDDLEADSPHAAPGAYAKRLTRLERAIARHIPSWAAEFPTVLPLFEGWLEQWRLTDPWIREELSLDVACNFPADLREDEPDPEERELEELNLLFGPDKASRALEKWRYPSSSVRFTASGAPSDPNGSDGSRGGLLGGPDIEVSPPLFFQDGSRLPAWSVLWTSRETYEERVYRKSARLSPDKTEELMHILRAWLDRQEVEFLKVGMVRAPRKESLEHMDALIRWQCLEWPWECIAVAAAIEPRSIKREVDKLASIMGLTLRHGRRGGRSRHGKQCLCTPI